MTADTAPSTRPDGAGAGAGAAFFDVDNTLVVGASMYHFARGLASRDFFTWRELAAFGTKQARLRLLGESRGHMASACSTALEFVAGKDVEQIVALSEQIYDEAISDKLWEGTRQLAQQHISAGRPVWLVTATPVELATIIARRLGLTGAMGTVAQIEDGRYTGRLVGEVLHGAAKAGAVTELAAREGLDLARCAAYSDSINDLPLLSLVGNPVAVNPDAALHSEASARGWEIRDFRRGLRKVTINAMSARARGRAFPAVLAAGKSA